VVIARYLKHYWHANKRASLLRSFLPQFFLTYMHPYPDCLLSLRYLQTFIAITRLRIQNDRNSPPPFLYTKYPRTFPFNLLGLDYQRLMSLLPPFCDDFLHETQFGGARSRLPLPPSSDRSYSLAFITALILH